MGTQVPSAFRQLRFWKEVSLGSGWANDQQVFPQIDAAL